MLAERNEPESFLPSTGGSDPLAGTSYRTIAALSEGSMGIVVEAEHRMLGARVAVKLLHPTLVGQADFTDRMRVEAQVLAALAWRKCPHIVTVSDFSVTPDGRPFLVMERLRGHTVAKEIELRGALPFDEAIALVLQVLAGLSVVHEAGIVHRDIKAGNIFLCLPEEGVRLVKLLDFGLAKVLTSAPRGGAPAPLRFPTGEGVALGTPRWLSPEQARGQPVDARADLYSVGMLLYALLTGKGPFDHLHGTAELFHAQAMIVPPTPSSRAPRPLPPGLDDAVMRALAKRPGDRFADAAEFAQALTGALDISNTDDTTLPPSRNRAPVLPWQARRFDTVPLSPGPSPSPSAAPARGPDVQQAPAMKPPHLPERAAPEPRTAAALPVPDRPNDPAAATLIVPKRPASTRLGVSIAVIALSAVASATLAALVAHALLFR
jgi:serine/threonine-protein kinase